ncbi:MAG: type IV pili methyl-accepting chemotaxis transducer N-terminal domain-containing protein, partial [Litoreibacter sp.]|nr:type IV pili methyl-accepting chemotaxis transducer N-terminal domain-containing protein [Litoreibacter sp.]
LLRVLSQEAASAACHMANDIATEEALGLMVEAKGKFSLLLDALQYGNPTLNIIGEEPRKKTVLKIEALREEWAPIDAAAVTLLDDPKTDNEAVLASASTLTSAIAGEYSNPAELVQADVMLLDFAGRQAMLTQKMAKIACEIWVGNRGADRLELLTKTMETYELTLRALLDGAPAVGLRAAPTDEIRVALISSVADWTGIKESLNVVLASADVPDATKSDLFASLNAAMHNMNKIEHKYVVFSKRSLDTDDSSAEGALLD